MRAKYGPSLPGHRHLHEVATDLGIPRRRLYRYVQKGYLIPTAHGSRLWLSPEQVEQVRLMYNRNLNRVPPAASLRHKAEHTKRLEERHVAW